MKTLLATAGAFALLTTSMTNAAETKPAADAVPPLLAPWVGPYGGVPPFDQVKVVDLKPGLETGMAQQLAEIDRIANDPAAPTFENTIAAMERTGRTLDRVSTVYGIYSSTLNDEAVQAVEREMAPKLAAFSDQITQNPQLFERIAQGLRDARNVRPHARAAAPDLGVLHELRARRRQAGCGGQEAHGGDQPGTRQAVHAVSARTCSRTKTKA